MSRLNSMKAAAQHLRRALISPPGQGYGALFLAEKYLDDALRPRIITLVGGPRDGQRRDAPHGSRMEVQKMDPKEAYDLTVQRREPEPFVDIKVSTGCYTPSKTEPGVWVWRGWFDSLSHMTRALED